MFDLITSDIFLIDFGYYLLVSVTSNQIKFPFLKYLNRMLPFARRNLIYKKKLVEVNCRIVKL